MCRNKQTNKQPELHYPQRCTITRKTLYCYESLLAFPEIRYRAPFWKERAVCTVHGVLCRKGFVFLFFLTEDNYKGMVFLMSEWPSTNKQTKSFLQFPRLVTKTQNIVDLTLFWGFLPFLFSPVLSITAIYWEAMMLV